MEENNTEMKMVSISVDKKMIYNNEFEIPERYNIITESEFENMFGGF